MGPVVPFIPAIIGGAASIFGAHEQAGAADDAAKTQAAAAEKALALQKEIFEQKRQDLAPYRDLGTGATGRLSDLWGFPSSQPKYTLPSNLSVPAPEPANLIQHRFGNTISVPNPQYQGGATYNLNGQPANPSSTKAPQVGDVRMINGQQGRWDGKGWEAI